jgi:primary-amine oxidase
MDARYEVLKTDIRRKDQVSTYGGNKTRHVGLSVTFICTIALTLFLYLRQQPTTQFPVESTKSTLYNGRVQQCPSGLPPPASPPAPINLWASIDLEEGVQIRKWLEAPERGLNISRVDPAYASSDNVIYNLEAYYPSKAEALAYLEAPFSVRAPDRYARVSINHGAQLEPIVKEYLVGPLPVSAQTEMRELRITSYPDGIPFNARGFFLNKEFGQFLGRITVPLREAMKVSVMSFLSP